MKNILLQNEIMNETKALTYRLYIRDMSKFINYSGLRFLHLSNCESIIKANDIKKENKNNKRKES